MRKRGEGKVKNILPKISRKGKIPKKGLNKGKPSARKGTHGKRAQSHISPEHSTSAKHAQRVSSQQHGSFVKKEVRAAEKEVVKETRFILSEQEFHIVTFVGSLIILAFMFNSWSVAFLAGMSTAVLAFGHFLHLHNHRPHHALGIIGIFVIPALVTTALFRDLLAWIMMTVYGVSIISTIILYYMHKKVHTPYKIMWQVTYSKTVAMTLTVLLAAVLPYIVLGDRFISFYELTFLFILPLAFVLFTLSKFLYIYFFDRKHILHDFIRGVKYGLIFSAAFVVIVLCVYTISAARIYNTQTESFNRHMETDLLAVDSIMRITDNNPEIAGLPITDDLSRFAAIYYEDAEERKRQAMEDLSLGEITDDSYLTQLMDNTYAMIRLSILKMEMIGIKSGIVQGKKMVDALGPETPEGQDAITKQAEEFKTFVDKNYEWYYNDNTVRNLMAGMNDPDAIVSYYEENGLFYWVADMVGADAAYNAKSISGRQLSLVLRHTKIAREFTRFGINMLLLGQGEHMSPTALQHLYSLSENDHVGESQLIRYALLADYIMTGDKITLEETE